MSNPCTPSVLPPELIEWRDARAAIFATPIDVKVGPALFARLAVAEHALMEIARGMAAPPGVEPGSLTGFKGPCGPGPGATEVAPPGGFEPPSVRLKGGDPGR